MGIDVDKIGPLLNKLASFLLRCFVLKKNVFDSALQLSYFLPAASFRMGLMGKGPYSFEAYSISTILLA